MEELNCDVVFHIPIFGGIPIYESVVVSWMIIAALLVVILLLTRNLKVENPKKGQLMLESIVSWVYKLFYDLLGEKGKRYIPYLMTVLMYLALSNLMGLIGFKPPTKDLTVTAALAIMSIILIEYAGIHAKGAKKWAKSFAEPVAIIAPLNVLEIVIRPLSLCMRLFGNMLGGFVVMELIKQILPVFLPILPSFYFDIFDGLLQAYVFVFLTSLFMKEAIEE
ncbi:F0F1 ATP synthase subunit A [Brotonthovivens ammoniilytica]|uniref:ATP synthase subunit a n=1 Tax=Brotonthovivens ammoniilytica TaxID=2981725 RepID=A0ABT2TQ61_9FIRM|nr:F0F1 ATP synthase subunit A [Brotonthovivens ammoniilytica]MCU6763604.1 F0F1 ATP synthase subunit A [Brotonthovivens ammoniilytica]